ncbi:hypothetical protein M440DRAFT_1336292, partial [Trichoderma longibrachiatum ATCC 18648]
KTYNSRCSLVVTHPTTNLPVSGLSMGERTGPRVFHYLWSYVIGKAAYSVYIDGLDRGNALYFGVCKRLSADCFLFFSSPCK